VVVECSQRCREEARGIICGDVLCRIPALWKGTEFFKFLEHAP